MYLRWSRGWAWHHVNTYALMGCVAPKGVDGLGCGTVTTMAQFAHAHSLQNGNFALFSVFCCSKITKNFQNT